jgi:hypothetical protein
MPGFVQLKTLGTYAVNYREYTDGYGENFSPDSSALTRICAVQWSQRRNFVWDMVGWTEAAPDSITGRLNRHLPEAHPLDSRFRVRSCVLRDKQGVPNQDAFGALTFDLRNGDGSLPINGESPGSGWAVYEVTYHLFNYNFVDNTTILSELDRYVIRNYKLNVENLTFPGQSFQWGSTGDAGQPAGTTIPMAIGGHAAPGDLYVPDGTVLLSYEWLQLPYPPWTNILNGVGKVNSGAFDSNYGTYPAETLLMLPPEVMPRQYPAGYFYWDVRYQFLYRNRGFNKAWSRSQSDFFKLVRVNDTSHGPFITYDFAKLFNYN